jgi:DNA-directed RNA polymerase subunit RPC12/RpoP
MPKVYECWNCEKVFKYEYINARITKDKNHMTVEIPCKQSTYGPLGSTGTDYICGECIEEVITEKGTS